MRVSQALSKMMGIVIALIIVVAVVAGVTSYYMVSSQQRVAIATPSPTPSPSPIITPQTPIATPTKTPEVKVTAIRIGTTEAGAVGYVLGSILANELKKIFPDISISTYPVGGYPINVNQFAQGNIELAYVGTIALGPAWKREPPFDTLPQGAKLPAFTSALYDVAFCLATTPELKGKLGINSWRDLDGKKVSIFTTGWMSHRILMQALQLLGIKVSHIELGAYSSQQADAIKRGDVVAISIHGTAGLASPGTLEFLSKMDLVIINPSPEDAEKVMKAGLGFTWLSVSAVNWTKPMGVDRMFCLVEYTGWHTSPDILPEDFVYKMLKHLIENKDKLAEQHAYLKLFAKDPVNVLVRAISLLPPEVPIHPGTAKLLKEYNAWKPEWDKRIAK